MSAWETTPSKFYDDDTAERLKVLFGEALCRHPSNPYDAAREVEPDNGRANWIVNNWLDDPVVVETRAARHATLGALAGLPSKEELARWLEHRSLAS